MNTQIFLIANQQKTTSEMISFLNVAFSGTTISAVLLVQGSLNSVEYEKLAKTALPIAQKNNCALLLDNCPNLAKKIGADGVHITDDIKILKQVIKELKPDMIVGAGNIFSKDDAMIKGESGVDYIFFGELEKSQNTQTQNIKTNELAMWWSKTFEVPAVFYDRDNKNDNANCEFIAINEIGGNE